MLARLFAARDLALGVALLQARGAEADRQVDIGIALDVSDLVALVLAASRKDISGRTLLMGGSLAAVVAGLGVLGRRVDS